MRLLNGQARVLALALAAAESFQRKQGIDRFSGHFCGTTGTSRCHPNNVRNKHIAFLKRVARRRAKKGYAHSKGPV